MELPAEVAGHDKQPVAELAWLAQLSEAQVCLDEGFLGDVLGQRVIAQAVESDTVDSIAEARHQLPEGLTVAVASQLREFCIAASHCRYHH